MKHTLTSLILLCFFSFNALAQKTYSVKGSVRDSVANTGLHNASVSVLNAKDSTLRKFMRATTNGSFNLGNLGKGQFILLVTYPDYADYVEKFTLDSVHTERSFGNINMALKSRLLKEVLIKGSVAAIKIKGDTTEYNAKAFVIQPNSKVEDLLKQLPGIQVDKDGKITAQGQTVQKVLVDGEEFFGDDPTLVTKNIRGDMVDKVQLYDKKSDQATFTGIDDGEKTKTINIKLKEDKKNGYFGKLYAGIGNDGYYEGQSLYNKFKGKQKMSAYFTLSNTGKTGLGWDDNNKLGAGGGMQFTDDGGAYFDGGGGDNGLDSFGGQYYGEGIPITRSGGLHFDNKWNKDKYALNTNYKIGSISIDGTRNNISQQNIDTTSVTGVIKSVSDQTSHNYMFRQKLDATLTVALDTTSNIKFSVDGTIKNSNTHSINETTSRRRDNSLLNTNSRNVDNDVDQEIFNATVFFTKKLKKKGRTLSVNFNTGFNNSTADGFLRSDLEIYNLQSQPTGTGQKIDQKKTDDTKTSKVNTAVTYTEPLSKYLSAIVSYGLSFNNSNADRKSFDQSAPGVYNILNDSLSNHYIFNQVSNRGGLNFNYKRGKSTLRFGTNVSDITFKQEDLIGNSFRKRSFTNWNPSANYQYKISTYGSLSLNYFGNQTQPTLDQLQPIRVNTDPLNVVIGNPLLKPSFTHRFSMWYNMYKVLSEQSIWFSGNYSFTNNPIINNINTNTAEGSSTIQAVNLTNHTPYNFNINMDMGRKITAIGLNIGARLSTNGNVYYSYVTTPTTATQLNRTNSNSYSGQLSLSKYKEKKYQIYINAGPNYSVGKSSIQTNINNNGRGFNADYYISVYLPFKFQISTDGQYEHKAATQSFATDFNQTIINASITKSFFKSEELKLALRGNDLLNQNSGFSRNASSNLFTQTQYTTIRRYFLLSIQWDFSGMGGGAPKK